jgi:surface antigen
MSSFDDRSRRPSNPVPIPGLSQLMPATGPLEAEETSTGSLPATTAGLPDSLYSPAATNQLTLEKNPAVTRVLPGISLNTSQHLPVVIKGERKKNAGPASLSQHSRVKRRLIVNLLGVVILCLVSGLMLLWVSPIGAEVGLHFPLSAGSGLINSQSGNMSLIAQATATAVYHQQTDGYDPSSNGTVSVTNGSGSLNWPYGQCTYWANERYHALTGYWVSWRGNADEWVTGARMAGWNVSQSPHIPSIIVLMPGVQGASSAYGHVAVAEKLINSTTVYASNMNYYANGGGFGIVSYYDFTVGSGVWFVWK